MCYDEDMRGSRQTVFYGYTGKYGRASHLYMSGALSHTTYSSVLDH